MKKLFALLLPLALVASQHQASASIERLTLDDMVSRTDDAVDATIVASRVFRVDHPVDGPELYYTALTLAGRSLADGRATTVDVIFPGGFVNENEGVWNSEAPSADDQRIGNHVIAFYKFQSNMGGGVSGNGLYASHGGIYRVAEGSQGPVVLGRGEGYAVANNVRVTDLGSAVRTIRSQQLGR